MVLYGVVCCNKKSYHINVSSLLSFECGTFSDLFSLRSTRFFFYVHYTPLTAHRSLLTAHCIHILQQGTVRPVVKKSSPRRWKPPHPHPLCTARIAATLWTLCCIPTIPTRIQKIQTPIIHLRIIQPHHRIQMSPVVPVQQQPEGGGSSTR